MGMRNFWSLAGLILWGLLACMMAGCGSKQGDDLLVQCQSTWYGVRNVEKIDIFVTKGGKIRKKHERELGPHEMGSLQEILGKANFMKMDCAYGRAIPDGGFRRIVANVDGVRHEVTLFPHADEEAKSEQQREDLKNFNLVWDHLVSISARE